MRKDTRDAFFKLLERRVDHIEAHINSTRELNLSHEETFGFILDECEGIKEIIKELK